MHGFAFRFISLTAGRTKPGNGKSEEKILKPSVKKGREGKTLGVIKVSSGGTDEQLRTFYHAFTEWYFPLEDV